MLVFLLKFNVEIIELEDSNYTTQGIFDFQYKIEKRKSWIKFKAIK